MAKTRVLGEFWQFLKQEKKYWLMPIVVVFVLILFAQSSAVAPFIYTLFSLRPRLACLRKLRRGNAG
jgi:hypothetical protein